VPRDACADQVGSLACFDGGALWCFDRGSISTGGTSVNRLIPIGGGAKVIMPRLDPYWPRTVAAGLCPDLWPGWLCWLSGGNAGDGLSIGRSRG
jgi:hypothetical protein